MKNVTGLFILIGLTAACSTSSISVRHDYDKEAPIKTYTTYQVVEPTREILDEMKIRNPRVLDVIESSIREEMEKRGYTASDNPDTYITYFVTSRERTVGRETGGVNVGVGYGGYYGGIGFGTRVGGRIEYVDYVEGTLIIDFYNNDKKVIWHGAARGTFQVDRENPLEVAREAVKRIMYKYKFKVDG